MNKLKLKTIIFLAVLTFLSGISSVSADTPINTTCTINTPGNYYLTSDISCNSGNALNITCSDVVIDGQGYIIDGSGSADHGIYVYNSHNTTIKNTNIKNFNYGIHLLRGYSNIIQNNTIGSTRYYGIYLLNSPRNIITNNSMNSKMVDIFIINSNENNIINNTLNMGIALLGTTLENWNTHTIVNNTIIGKEIYYFKNTVGKTVPTDAGEVILANCSEMKLENLNLSDVGSGVILSYSSNNNISAVTINSNSEGIWLTRSTNNSITGNNISSNYRGVTLYSSPNNAIVNNNLNLNHNAIFSSSSSNTIIKGNNVSLNYDSGIYLYSCSNNQIYNNIFNNTRNYNILSCGVNYWNTSKELGGGNYWFTPTGTGFSEITPDWNNDGFCDCQYNVTVDNTDYLPILWDKTPPEISTITPVTKTVYNKSSFLINVTVNDSLSLISSVSAEIENITNITLTLNGSYYTANTGNLSDGVYNITVTAVDANENINTDKIKVTVDTTYPSVVINNGYGPYNYNSNILNVTVTDATPVTVIAEINGTENITLKNISGYFGNSKFEFSEGEHTVKIYARDTAGNVNTTEPITVLVDTTAPAVTINTPVNGTTFTKSSVLINVTANDSLSNVSSVVAEIGSVKNVTLSFDGEYYTGSTGTLSNGNYEIRILAADLIGNVNSSENISISIAVPSSSSSRSSHSSSSDVSDDIESDVIRNAVSDSDLVYGNSFDKEYAGELKETTHNSEDYEISGNTIIVGGPESNKLAEKYDSKFGISISNENPGENKGIIQVLKVQDNTGSIIQSYTVIYIAGSDRYGTRAALEYFKTLDELPNGPVVVEWTENGPVLVE
ncbi:parallel beta-helix repeat protein [Methanococcus maripaludis]|uniref:Parallel beta-helix repeat protein n=1 Tax=Methanococcus maripaludis TaxID=39152 RepID=A0A7J9NU33_METMI|nr:NosD domain-containing protein [Methanococcus maripaludis]MBA2851200.1 parallel beta-helix repeat protein [Methanococcus maripaludis]